MRCIYLAMPWVPTPGTKALIFIYLSMIELSRTNPNNSSSAMISSITQLRQHTNCTISAWHLYPGHQLSHNNKSPCETCWNQLYWSWKALKTLRLEQNRRHFADDSFKHISLNWVDSIWFKFHWKLFQRVKLTISQHWLMCYRYRLQCILYKAD